MLNNSQGLPDFLSVEAMRASLDEFFELYERRPISNNSGGMGLNHSWALWYLLRSTAPKVVVESGVWMGHSSWIIENASPDSQLFCFDINFKNLVYRSKDAVYFENDFSRFDWSGIDTQGGLCFFDDHQNALERIIQSKWFGFDYAIIEDNWPVNEGDCYSIRHMQAGVGFPESQMSKMYLGGLSQRRKRRSYDRKLLSLYDDQKKLVKPNKADFANLVRNTDFISEMNPVYLEKKNNWGLDYSPLYATKPQLLDHAPVPDADYSYSYLTFLKLQRSTKK
jgi:hypothetical protein